MYRMKLLLSIFVLTFLCGGPVCARFLSIDPVGAEQDIENGSAHGFNRYAYANNNPYKFVDPDGRDAVGIVYKRYQVDTGYGFTMPLGHAGVLLIDNSSGLTKYYEYGRYPSNDQWVFGEKLEENKGNVRNIPIPNAVIGKNGKPSKESLDAIYGDLSRITGKGNEVATDYHEGADFNKMEKYVRGLANDKNREQYSLPFCNCYNFKNRVIDAGRREE